MPEKMSVLQACSMIDLHLPHFCYHENLSIAGNCRMCLVETNDNKKLQVACATEITSNVHVYSNTYRVKKANESVLEFLLINHPLDCPICDQGGECDLQDLTMFFGSDRGRFYEIQKRAVEDKFLGSFIKTIMTRCIHCTRCIRFLKEISDDFSLGLTGRGSAMEITTYIKSSLHRELSGNIIDICPVGALTSKPYAFRARPWEAKAIFSIDIFDSVCSSIRLDVFNNKVLRILPISNSFINEDWITNKIRFCYDSFSIQRLSSPLYKIKDEILLRVSWRRVFKFLSFVLFQDFVKQVECKIGDSIDLISLQTIKDFFNSYGHCNFIGSTTITNVDFRSSYLLNSSLYNLEFLDMVILVGVNTRLEFPLLNLRLRKRYLKSDDFVIYNFGLGLNYFTFPVENINSIFGYMYLMFGKNLICKKILKIKNSKIFLGKSLLKTPNFNCIYNLSTYSLSIINKLYPNYNNILGILENQPGSICAYDLGMFTSINGKCLSTEFIYDFFVLYFIFGASDLLQFIKSKFKFIIYFGCYGNEFLMNANIILPTTLFVETESIYTNIEGFAQIANVALSLIGDCRDLSSILNALCIYFNTVTDLKAKSKDWFLSNITFGNNIGTDTYLCKAYSFHGRFMETLPLFKYSKFHLYYVKLNLYSRSYLKFINKLADEIVYHFYRTNDPIVENSMILNSVPNMDINSFNL
jgi:NADH-quinone oxidoreductase chain G